MELEVSTVVLLVLEGGQRVMRKMATTLFSLLFVAGYSGVAFSQSSTATKGSTLDQYRAKTNENTVVIITGNLNGSYLKIGYDIAATVDDGDNLRVLPVVGKGAVQNMRDILFLRGVDMGLINTVTWNYFKTQSDLSRHIANQVVYITRLFEDEFHLLARPEISTLKDLEGKRVNYSDVGSGAQLSAQLMFKGFGMSPKEFNMGQADAIEMMKRGEMDATICTCLKPLGPYKAVPKELGFKLISIPLEGPMVDDYVPASFTHQDYPNLVPEGTTVETVAVPTVLAAYNWPAGHDRYRRLAKFTEAMFSKLDSLQKPPRHPRWKSVNLAAELKGWTRFQPAQQWLDKASGARGQEARAAPANPGEQERLFNQFLEYKRQQQQ